MADFVGRTRYEVIKSLEDKAGRRRCRRRKSWKRAEYGEMKIYPSDGRKPFYFYEGIKVSEDKVYCIYCDVKYKRSKTVLNIVCIDCQEENRLKTIESNFKSGGFVKGLSVEDKIPARLSEGEALLYFERQP